MLKSSIKTCENLNNLWCVEVEKEKKNENDAENFIITCVFIVITICANAFDESMKANCDFYQTFPQKKNTCEDICSF